MKNVLIICGTFPPQSSVGGLRPAMFAKYLGKFGWNPIIVTRDFTEDDPRYDQKMPIELPEKVIKQTHKIKYSIHDEEYYLVSRSFLKKIRDFFYPEYSSPPGLYFAVKKYADDFISKVPIDLILTTSPDQWELTLGAYLSKKKKIPLVADFRDIKEQEDGLKRPLRQHLQRFRFVLRRNITSKYADHYVTVSKYHQSILRKKLNNNVSLIYNGFDSDLFKPIPSKRKSNSLRIFYVGRIIDFWYQNPELIFKAIDQLIVENKICENDIIIDFFGTDKEKTTELLSQLTYKSFIRFHERVSYNDVPRLLNDCDFLLLLTNHGRKGVLTTKLFEYAGVRKPILCIPGDQGELDQLIKEYNLGYSFSSLNDLKEKLTEWVICSKQDQMPSLINTNFEHFSRENQTRLLSKVLDEVYLKHKLKSNLIR